MVQSSDLQANFILFCKSFFVNDFKRCLCVENTALLLTGSLNKRKMSTLRLNDVKFFRNLIINQKE